MPHPVKRSYLALSLLALQRLMGSILAVIRGSSPILFNRTIGSDIARASGTKSQIMLIL
jgi:hypothetical protein